MRFVEGDFDDPQVIALLQTHVVRAHAETGRGSAHALNITGLKKPGIRFWALWSDDRVTALGALKHLSPDHGEVKSMHTAEHARKKGMGSAMLDHIMDEAGRMGMSRLSLETGAWDYFIPARAFYRRHGFAECGPFADYKSDPNSIFMTRTLDRAQLEKGIAQ
jgi:putative acetyltransferase